MLLNFTMENYRSFRESTTFSMEACSQEDHLSILIRKQDKKIKPSGVVYGTNASGKTNIFRAMWLMRDVVLEGSFVELRKNTHIEFLLATPFLYGKLTDPVRLAIEFETDGTIFEYQFSYQIERTEKQTHNIVIVEEKLSKNKHCLFERSEDLDEIIKLHKQYGEPPIASLRENLDHSTLFLTGGFSNVVSRETANAVRSFFESNFVDCDDLIEKINKSCPDKKESEFVCYRTALLKRLSEYNLFGKQKFSYISLLSPSGERQDPCLYSNYPLSAHAYVGRTPSEIIESTGTLRILNLFMAIEKCLAKGLVLCLDELDHSIHFNLMISLIKLFHDPEVNKHGAQLIYNTHNPIYMHGDVFRRDQIFIVEKDSETCESELFTLSEFSSINDSSDHNYFKNYVKGNYSSIPFYDFSSIFVDEEDQDETE